MSDKPGGDYDAAIVDFSGDHGPTVSPYRPGSGGARQCKLERDGRFQTAWIEARGARVGATVELLPSVEHPGQPAEPWRVVVVY